MNVQLFDSHAHLTYDALFHPEVLMRAVQSSVTSILNIAVDEKSFERGFQLHQYAPPSLSLYHAAATTPHELTGPDDPFFSTVALAVQQKKLTAIGETGLDFYRNPSEKSHQEAVFLRYAQLAVDAHLPLIIHCRQAFDTLFPILRTFGPSLKGVIHCFTGTKEEAKTLLDLGWPLSISGIVTFSKSESLQEIVRFLPIDRMLVETDAPYLAPGPKRGQTNEPAFLTHTVEAVASIKGVSFEEVAHTTFANATDLFQTQKLV